MTDKLQLSVSTGDTDAMHKQGPDVTNRYYRLAGKTSAEFPYEWWKFVEERIYEWQTLRVVVANAWYSGFSICVSYHHDSELSSSRLDFAIAQLLAECTGKQPEDVEINVDDRVR